MQRYIRESLFKNFWALAAFAFPSSNFKKCRVMLVLLCCKLAIMTFYCALYLTLYLYFTPSLHPFAKLPLLKR